MNSTIKNSTPTKSKVLAMLTRISVITTSCIFMLWINTAYADNEKYLPLDRSCSSIVCKHSIENTSFQYDKEENLVFSSDKTSNMDKISSSLYVILENKEDKNNNDIDSILDVVELWEE